MNIPEPVLNRLCRILTTLDLLEAEGNTSTSSRKLEALSGISAHTLRKDFSFLDNAGNSGSGYEISSLKQNIENLLGLNAEKKVCIAGLGRLGEALFQYPGFNSGNFKIIAGFDRSVNKIELMQTEIELFPSYMIEEVIREKQIDIGIITVPAEAALQTAERMINGGIKGILNFAPVRIVAPEKVQVQNIYAVDDLRIVAAMINNNQ